MVSTTRRSVLAPWLDPARRAPARLDGLLRVRSYGCHTGEWGPPLVYNRYAIDRGDVAKMLTPYDGARSERLTREWERKGEWLRSPLTGQWVPLAVAAMALPTARMTRRAFLAAVGLLGAARLASAADFSPTRQASPFVTGLNNASITPGSSATTTTINLDITYLFGATGKAASARVILVSAKTLATVLYFITAGTGTVANVNDINFELRNDNASLTSPSTTLHTSASGNPNSDASFTGWHSLNPADFAMSAGVAYWPIIADADGGLTDFATVLVGTAANNANPILHCFDTADGFLTAAVIRNTRAPSILLVFTDGTILGMSLTADSATSSSTNRKGVYLNAPFTEQIKCVGFLYTTGTSSVNGGEIYDSSTVPGGTPLASALIAKSLSSGLVLFAPYTLGKGTIYRMVATYGSANTNPIRVAIGTANGNDTNLRIARPGGGNLYWCEANGTTNWANDSQDHSPAMAILFEDTVAVPASGGKGFLGG